MLRRDFDSEIDSAKVLFELLWLKISPKSKFMLLCELLEINMRSKHIFQYKIILHLNRRDFPQKFLSKLALQEGVFGRAEEGVEKSKLLLD